MENKFYLDRNNMVIQGQDALGTESGFHDPFWDIDYPPVSEISIQDIYESEETYLLHLN